MKEEREKFEDMGNMTQNFNTLRENNMRGSVQQANMNRTQTVFNFDALLTAKSM